MGSLASPLSCGCASVGVVLLIQGLANGSTVCVHPSAHPVCVGTCLAVYVVTQ